MGSNVDPINSGISHIRQQNLWGEGLVKKLLTTRESGDLLNLLRNQGQGRQTLKA